jgi:hypothetical protein
MEMAYTPPSGMSVELLAQRHGLRAGLPACWMRPLSSAAARPPTWSVMKSMPGDTISRS